MPSSNNLKGGAIAGIVIGVIAGVALLAGLLWFLLRRNRKAGPNAAAELPVEKGSDAETSVLDSKALHEIDSNERTELPYSRADAAVFTELPSPEAPKELEGQDPIELDAGHPQAHLYNNDVKS